jgi:hypothetical protein
MNNRDVAIAPDAASKCAADDAGSIAVTNILLVGSGAAPKKC